MWIVKVLEINNSGEGGGVEIKSKEGVGGGLKGFSKINREEGDYSVL